MGVEYFENNRDYDDLRDPKVPLCFLWLFNTFTELYVNCGESLTWSELESYSKIRKIDFTQSEIDYILLMNGWANHQIKQLRDEKKE